MPVALLVPNGPRLTMSGEFEQASSRPLSSLESIHTCADTYVRTRVWHTPPVVQLRANFWSRHSR
jgi:hypothetical protein